MKTNLLSSVVLATLLGATVAASSAAPVQPASFRGNAAADTAATDRAIVVNDRTRYVNVTGGSTVRFVVGDRTFNWSFENGSATVIPFDLAQIAPQGVVNHPVVVYVSDNPLYHGN